MPTYYPTGRQRTVTFSGAITANMRLAWYVANIEDTEQHASSDFLISALFGSVAGAACNSAGNAPNGSPATVDNPSGQNFGGSLGVAHKHTYYVLRAATGLGATDEEIWELADLAPGGVFADDFDGEWTISADVEEVLLVEDDGFAPNTRGAAVNDSPSSFRGYLIERLRIGGSVTATVTALGHTVTATDTITSGNQALLEQPEYVCRRHHSSWALGGFTTGITASCTVTANFQGNAIPGKGYTRVVAGSGYGGQVTDSTTQITVNRFVSTSYGVYVDNSTCPVKAWSLTGVLRAMEDPYPNTLTLMLDRKRVVPYAPETLLASATFGDSYEQEWYVIYSHMIASTFSWSTGTVDGGISKNEWADFRIWCDPSATPSTSLLARGEDSRDWRLPIKGRSWSAFTLTQSASVTVHGALWSGAGPANMTLALPSASTDASLKGASFSGASLAGYRFLRLRVKASTGSSAFEVQIGTKTWETDYLGNTLQAGTVYADFDIDLCAPTSETAATDVVDTKWPLPTADGAYYGVTACTSLVLAGLAGGVTYDVETIAVVRHSRSNATFLPAFDHWVASSATPGAAEYRTRLLLGDTDGRQSKEETDFSRVLTGSVYAYSVSSLTTIISQINGSSGAYPADGWTATGAGSFPDTYHTNDRPSSLAWGAGALYVAEAWQYGFDKNAIGSLDVRAQMHYDLVGWYPECGDGFWYDDGSYGGALQIAAAKIMRGQAHGLVLQQGKTSAVAITVTVDNGTDGEGGTDAIGSYQAGLPYPKGLTTKTVKAEAGTSPPSVSLLFRNRKRNRASFYLETLPKIINPWNLQDSWGRYHRTGKHNGKIYYYSSDCGIPLPSWRVAGVQVTSGSDDQNPRMGIDPRGILFLTFYRDPDVRITSSYDDGATWISSTVAIPSAKYPTIAIHPQTGLIVIAAYSLGNIKATLQEAGESTASSPFTFKDDTGANMNFEEDTFHIQPACEGPMRWVMECHIYGESESSTWWSADDCKTWKRVM